MGKINSRAKGAKGERLFRDICREHGFDDARRGNWWEWDIISTSSSVMSHSHQLPAPYIVCHYAFICRQLAPWFITVSVVPTTNGTFPLGHFVFANIPILAIVKIEKCFCIEPNVTLFVCIGFYFFKDFLYICSNFGFWLLSNKNYCSGILPTILVNVLLFVY